MSKLAESLITRHFPNEGHGYSYKRLAGGISNETLKVTPSADCFDQSAIVLTIIRDPLLWWKIEQEFALRNLIAGDPEVPLPHLFDAGFDSIEGEKIAFIFREFVQGVELDDVLEKALHTKTKEHDFSSLASDLGHRLGAMHKHGGAIFGQLARSKEVLYSHWSDFVLSEISNEVRLTSQLHPDQQLGRIKASTVQSLLPKIQELVGSMQSALSTISTPNLAHGDAHFKNIIAGQDEVKSWKIKSFIDTEEALGGDPEIDVTYIENWLHFSAYKKDFFKKQAEFRFHYTQQHQIGDKYFDRRLIYHALRSLSFLRTVFEFDANKFLSANSKNEEYVFQHFQILRSLSDGNSLEDVDIPSLL
jgi:tRNA A-37 threonylcarbamoyl transferase component Bud32